MITPSDVSPYLSHHFPEFNATQHQSLLQAIKGLTDFTRLMVKEHHTRTVSHCFDVARALYENGNSTVKNAVENIFVYSFSALINAQECNEDRTWLQNMIPRDLYNLYVGQIVHSNI